MKYWLWPFLVVVLVPMAPGAWQEDEDERRQRRVTPIVEVVREVGPTVVNLYSSVDYKTSNFFGTYTASTGSLGAGVIIHPSGIVVTNSHVITANLIEGVRRITVTVTYRENWSGRESSQPEKFEATLLGFDPRDDLALLKINSDRTFRAATLGTSSDLMIGETVVAVGNPYGREGSVTHGIISATDREFAGPTGIEFDDIIQTDVPLNGGNSGGPLFNILGELIGINQAIGADRRMGRAEGQGLAIPVDRVRKLLEHEFDPYGLAHGYLGLELVERNNEVRVLSVEEGSPAELAGLRPADQVRRANDYPVSSKLDFNLSVLSHESGHAIPLTIERRGDTEVLTLVPLSLDAVIAQQLGVQIGIQSGRVVVMRVAANSPAAQLGLQGGDIIYSLGKRRIQSRQDVFEIARTLEVGNLYVRLLRNGRWLEGELPIR